MSPKATHASIADHDFRMMVQIDMDMARFHSNWAHCDYVATYLARTISHNRPDSVLFANLFSSALNELLEITFRSRQTDGILACKLLRHDDVERIELTFSCREDEQRFFNQAVARVQGGNTEADYISSLSGDPGLSRDMLLVELAVSYNAAVSINTHDNGTITLAVDLPLGALTH